MQSVGLSCCYNSASVMSGSIFIRLMPELYKSILSGFPKTKCSTTVKSYSRNSNILSDPRKNARYSYVQGDPLHEDVIKRITTKNSLSMLKEKYQVVDSKKKEELNKQKDVFETVSGLKIERLMHDDIRLGKAIIEAKSKQAKTAVDTILLEGQRLIKDALKLGAQAKSLYFCDSAILESLPTCSLKDVGLYKISYKDLKIWSDTTTPAGILGIFKKPHQGEVFSVGAVTLPITLILDSVKDPGNAGTLIRTAAAVGCERVIATKGSVNVWDCKVLRSAMGGHFSVPIYSGVNWSGVYNYLEDSTQIFLANSKQTVTLTSSFDSKLQNEDLKVSVENGINTESEESGKTLILAKKYVNTFQNVPLPVCEHTEIKVKNPESSHKENGAVSAALVVGGEIGLSEQAKRFAYEHYGHCISIPMNKTINSLNTAVAGSIILYELRKKMLE